MSEKKKVRKCYETEQNVYETQRRISIVSEQNTIVFCCQVVSHRHFVQSRQVFFQPYELRVKFRMGISNKNHELHTLET